MSWSITFMRTSDEVNSYNDLPEGFHPPLLGLFDDLILRLNKILPGIRFEGKWGVFSGINYSIDFNLISMNNNEEISMIGAFIRGGNEAILQALMITEELDCSVFDDGSGQRILPE